MLKHIKTVHFRRKREGKTNYKKRLKILISNKIRMVVRKSLKNIYAQLIEYRDNGDIVKFSASSSEIRKLGWKISGSNMPASYLTGYLLGKKAVKKNMDEAILDIGRIPPIKGSKVFAVVKGAKDAGINIPVDNEMLPSDDDVKGNRISNYGKLLGGDNMRYSRYYSSYLKIGLKPEEVSNLFSEVKKNLESSDKIKQG